MPIDPVSGLYEQAQGSPFPNGVFGGALSVNNAVIGQRLANEAENRRMLQDQMSQMQLEKEGNLLHDDEIKRQRQADEDVRSDAFRQYVLDHPDADTTELLHQALGYGVKDTTTLSNMVYHENIIANKDAKIGVDITEQARKFAKDRMAQVSDPKIAADEGRKMFPQEALAPFWDKLAMQPKADAMTQATLNQKNAAANASNASAEKARAATGKTSDVDKLKKERDHWMGVMQNTSNTKSNIRSQLLSPDTVSIAEVRYKEAAAKVDELNKQIAALEGAAQVAKTPPPPPPSVKPVPPKFKDPGCPPDKEGRTAQMKLDDGTVVTAKCVGGHMVPQT